MKLEIECSRCGDSHKADVLDIIVSLIKAAENKSIYCGFICEECNEKCNQNPSN